LIAKVVGLTHIATVKLDLPGCLSSGSLNVTIFSVSPLSSTAFPSFPGAQSAVETPSNPFPDASFTTVPLSSSQGQCATRPSGATPSGVGPAATASSATRIGAESGQGLDEFRPGRAVIGRWRAGHIRRGRISVELQTCKQIGEVLLRVRFLPAQFDDLETFTERLRQRVAVERGERLGCDGVLSRLYGQRRGANRTRPFVGGAQTSHLLGFREVIGRQFDADP